MDLSERYFTSFSGEYVKMPKTKKPNDQKAECQKAEYQKAEWKKFNIVGQKTKYSVFWEFDLLNHLAFWNLVLWPFGLLEFGLSGYFRFSANRIIYWNFSPKGKIQYLKSIKIPLKTIKFHEKF